MSASEESAVLHDVLALGFTPRVRFATDDDRNAILKPWLSSFLGDRPSFADHVERATAFDEHDALIQGILKRPETITLVVCNPEDERHIMSWICGELRPHTLVLHYGGTFRFARGFGLFRMLLDKLLAERGERELVFTHWSRKSRVIGPAIGATYNPYRIFQ